MKQTILIFTANPKNSDQLRLDEEIREIDEGLTRARMRDQFELESKWATRHRDLRRGILDFSPYIVHFSGHGVGDEGVVLEDATGKSKLVSTEALADLFKLFSKEIECVVLNACYSEAQAEAIVQHIPYVVGTNQAISDKAALEFSIGFYDALGAGRGIEFAYSLGCSAIRTAGISEHLTPVLLKKSDSKSNSTGFRHGRSLGSSTELTETKRDRFSELLGLLEAKNWKEADRETEKVLNNNRPMRIEDIEAIPCEDWLLVDELWSASSHGRFGLSSQVKIWNKAGEDNEIFNELVGWKKNGKWASYNNLNMSELAPEGHFPTFWSSTKTFKGFRCYLFSKIRSCSELY